MSVLLIQDVPIECINQAALRYHVPAAIIVSVLKTEGGHQGRVSQNKNGTADLGPMQNNTIWIKKLHRYGVSEQQVKFNPCVNVNVGAWILGQAIAKSPSYWVGVANYHSHSPRYNLEYQQKVRNHFTQLSKVLYGES